MKNQKGSSRLDAALKMLLIAFISLLAFSSGVYFGKQMSDTDYQLKALESDFKDQTTKTASEEGGGKRDKRPDDALVDEDVAAAGEKLVNEAKKESAHGEKRSVASEKPEAKAETRAEAKAEAKAEGHAAQAPAKHEAKAEAKHQEHAVAAKHEAKAEAKHEERAAAPAKSEAADRVAMNEAPGKDAKPKADGHSRALPTSIGSPSEGEFTVQIASYPEAAEAKAHAADLVKKGYPAYPVEATVKGKTWYRVSVGSFKTSKEAGVYRAQLLKQTELRAAIVQKIER